MTRGLLGQQGRQALLDQLALLGPRVHRETPALQAIRVRLEMLVHRGQPELQAQKARKVMSVRKAM